MKRDLYEGGIRVPLIACWPGRIPADTQSDLVCGFQDILPTLAEASGQAIELTDGISFLPTLLSEKTVEPPFAGGWQRRDQQVFPKN